MSCLRSIPRRAALVLLACTAGACGNPFARFEDGGATVFVFSTHHATPEDGGFPFRGDDDNPRVFQNDTGWEITLVESYVITSAVTLVGCDEEPHTLDMFWGPLPEDLRDEDLATISVAGTQAAPGDYCRLEVEYGPYVEPVPEEGDEEDPSEHHEPPPNDQVPGATVYLRGVAQLGGNDVQFELRATGTLDVELDLSQLEGEGSPMSVAHDEDFPKELTVSKTYDRFFDGVDFATLDPAQLSGDLLDILEEQTRVTQGTRLSADPAEPEPD